MALGSTPKFAVTLVATVAVALAGGVNTSAAAPSKAPAASVAKKGKAATAPRKLPRASLHARNITLPAAVVVPIVDERAISHNAAAIAREFDRWLDGIEASGNIAGLAATIVKDDQVLLERGIGYANWDTQEPVGADTVFRLASLSKAFATALAGTLVEDGLLQWSTKVTDLLPTFTLKDTVGSQRLTVNDLLSHRVGLPHNTYDHLLEQDEPYELLVDRLKDVPLTCAVGECYGYQNIAFSLIGDITYAATSDFYYHQVEKRLFHPLRMQTATYGRDALESSKSWARPHRQSANSWVPFEPNETYYRVAPAAGVNASIRDMQQWLIAQMGGRPNVLSPALLQTLHSPLVETARETRSSPWRRGRLNEAQYALGWRVYDYAGTTLVYHAGAVKGYRALIAFLPDYRFGTVLLWNCESALPAGLLPMLLDRYLGLPEVNWAGIEPDDSADFTGGAD
jgi:beta-lactamase class C